VRSLQTLAFEEVRSSKEAPEPNFTAFVFHGLLGSGRNWRSFSRNLVSSLAASNWKVVLVDLRNHGKSAEIEGLSPPHDMENAAKDLVDLIKEQGFAWPDAVLGHSMGGKVALQFAKSCSNGDYGDSVQLPKQVWVLDSVPGKVRIDNSEGEVEKVLKVLQNLSSTIPSRKWLVDYMLNLGFSKSLSDWIGSNLKNSGDQMTWAFDLNNAIQMFDSYRETEYWDLLENPPNGMDIELVRGENSDRWNPDLIQRLEKLDESKANVNLHLLKNSGHWIHVDNPKGLLEIVAPKIASLALKSS
jgi:pimeloyl-ACP methyl ester carboxylesterase